MQPDRPMHIAVSAAVLAMAWLVAVGEVVAQESSTRPIPGQTEASERSDQISQELDQMRQLIEIQQRELTSLKRFVEFMAEETAAIEGAGNLVELGTEVESLKAGSVRAAERDEQVQWEIDRLTEELTADRSDSSWLPSTLKESYLPSRYDQTPIVMYNTLQTGYTDLQDEDGNFVSSAWLPHFYMTMREEFQIQINPSISSERIEILSGQIDWFARDDLTVTAGRFYTPLGFLNERLHTSWVIKTPDDPLIFEQIYPHQSSMNGVQMRGGKYLGDLPVKLEYSVFGANGFSLEVDAPTQKDFANFNLTRRSFDDVNHDKAVGGRLGLSFPTIGLIVGASGLANGAYDKAGQEDLTLVDIDASLHRGNWDLRFEYARLDQQTPFGPIDRQGFYFQTAYRNYKSIHPVLGQLEYVFRFDWVDFEGIDLAATGLDFGSSHRVPIDRNRYTAGVNYYFLPSLILKLAYEINNEREFAELKDNGFLAQLTWGF